MGYIHIEIPEDFGAEELAVTLSTYLLGRRHQADPSHIPHPVQTGGHSKWQLDEHNDFWLEIIGAGAARITWREDGISERRRKRGEAIAALFKATFNKF